MAQAKLNRDKDEVIRKRKIETTYEYIPILGEVLGFWRKIERMRVGETIEVYLNHSFEEYDRIVVNGIDITDKLKIKE